MSTVMPRAPLIAVVGATGTGKSQLAVDLAIKYNGEIINGDALQLYSGLPIITNKIPDDERHGVPHHLLGCISLHEPTWTVTSFVTAAQKTIDEIRSRGRLPILVGGTHYYTQSLLFHDTLAASSTSNPDSPDSSSTTHAILSAPTADILTELRKVDPIMADRWHPNDRRKIQRSLEIYLQTGQKASSIYSAQHTLSSDEPATRLKTETLVLWVHCSSTPLSTRLATRVNTMLSHGLLNEVSTLSTFSSTHPSIDTSLGIFVAIGYKEFLPYQALLHSPDATPEALTQALADAVEKTKIATRQYAKRQVRWIRIKLASALREAEASGNFFLLDGSEIAEYGTRVTEKGTEIAGKWLRGETLPEPADVAGVEARELLEGDKGDMAREVGAWKQEYCAICGMTAVTESDWRQHLASKRHRVLCRRKRDEERAGGEDGVKQRGKVQGTGEKGSKEHV